MNQTKFTNSESTMSISRAATQTFDHLLESIKNSNLNFHLQQSPFSALISLKKSPIKDANGVYAMPTIPIPATMSSDYKVPKSEPIFDEQKLCELEENNKILKLMLDKAVRDAEEAHLNNSKLENQLDILKTKVPSEKIDNLKNEIKSVASKFEKTRHDLSELKTENDFLRKTLNSNSIQLKAAKKDVQDVEKVKNIEIKKLQNELENLRNFKQKHDKEQAELKKKHKRENKKKKRELEKEAREKLKI